MLAFGFEIVVRQTAVASIEVAASCDLKHNDLEHNEPQLINILTLPQCNSQCKNKDVHACDDAVNKSYADMGMKNTTDSTKPTVTPSGFESRYRKPLTSTCTGPHESCCPAPMDDIHNCPDSARTSDCDAQKSCCCA